MKKVIRILLVISLLISNVSHTYLPIITYAMNNDIVDESVELPDESVELRDESVELPDESVELPDESVELRDESVELPDESVELPDESVELRDESVELPDESVELPDESVELPDESVELPDESVELQNESLEESISFFNTVQDDIVVYDMNVVPSKTLITDKDNYEYYYDLNYNIPKGNGESIFLVIKFEGNLELINNEFNDVNVIGTNYENNELKIELSTKNENIIGNIKIPVKFNQPNTGDIASGEYFIRNSSNEVIFQSKRIENTIAEVSYGIDLSISKLNGDNIKKSDRSAEYEILLKNDKNINLNGFTIINNLSQKAFDFNQLTDFYLRDKENNEVSLEVGEISYNKQDNQVRFKFNQDYTEDELKIYIKVNYKSLVENEIIKNEISIIDRNSNLVINNNIENLVEDDVNDYDMNLSPSKNEVTYKDDYGYHYNLNYAIPKGNGESVFLVIKFNGNIELTNEEFNDANIIGTTYENNELKIEFRTKNESIVGDIQLPVKFKEPNTGDIASGEYFIKNKRNEILLKPKTIPETVTDVFYGIELTKVKTGDLEINKLNGLVEYRISLKNPQKINLKNFIIKDVLPQKDLEFNLDSDFKIIDSDNNDIITIGTVSYDNTKNEIQFNFDQDYNKDAILSIRVNYKDLVANETITNKVTIQDKNNNIIANAKSDNVVEDFDSNLLLDVTPSKTLVNQSDNYEYYYNVSYKIPQLKEKVYLTIDFSDKIQFQSNTIISGTNFGEIIYENNQLKIEILPTNQPITGTLKIPVKFNEPNTGDLGRVDYSYQDISGKNITESKTTEDTLVEVDYGITLSKNKVGSDVIFQDDGVAEYKITVKNPQSKNLIGFLIKDILPEKIVEFNPNDFYLSGPGGVDVSSNIGILTYDEKTREITFKITDNYTSTVLNLNFSVRYLDLKKDEIIKNQAVLYDRNNNVLTSANSSNQVREEATGSFFGKKRASSLAVGYKDTVIWNIVMKNPLNSTVEKFVMEDTFPFHMRLKKIELGKYTSSNASNSHMELKLYIKTKMNDNYTEYKTLNSDEIFSSTSNTVIFEDEYLTDQNYITAIKIEMDNVPAALNQVIPIRLYTEVQPTYESGETLKNGDILENKATFKYIENGKESKIYQHKDSAEYLRAYLGMISKKITGSIPENIGDAASYTITVTSRPEINLPNPVVWDQLADNLEFKDYSIRILDKNNKVIVSNPDEVLTFEYDTVNNILRWKFNYILPENSKIIINLNTTLKSISYNTTNKSGLSTLDIPSVQGVQLIGSPYNMVENGVDLDGNGQFGDLYVGSNVSFNNISAINISAKKQVKLLGDIDYSDDIVNVHPRDIVNFRLIMKNNTNDDVVPDVIYDLLPMIGDRNSLLDSNKNSKFDTQFIENTITIKIRDREIKNAKVLYSNSLDPIRVNADGTSMVGTGAWQENYSDDVKAIKIELPDNEVVSANEELIVEYSVKVSEQAEVNLTAKNNFSLVANKIDGSKLYPIVSNMVTLRTNGYSVELTKVDADNNKLKLGGAEFRLLDSTGKEIMNRIITTADGKIVVNDLKPGHYQLVETQAPTGYVLDATPILFEIVKNQQTVLELSVENTLKPGGVKVTKVDADDQTPLAGAEFKILAADGSEIKTGLTTNDQGILEVNDLKPEHYQLVETQAPTGYVLDATPIPFEIVKNQQTVLELSVENTLKPGGVKVTKVDADDQTPLAGAEFKILAADGSEIKTGLTTNDQGILEVNDLKPGHYQLVETQAPTGYVLDATPIPFEIVKNQQTVLELSVENTLKPGGVKVTKVDADDQTPLAGAEFKILAADGSEIKTGLTTNDQGILEVNDLKPGHYQLVETQAPTGYVLDATPIPFEIVKNQQTVLELSVENTLKPGGVKVTKVDADDQTPLAGAEFKILAADGSEIKTGLTTNDQGILEVNDLKPGHYQLVETQAPTGYVLDATPIPFEIVKNQQTVLELSVENTLKPGGVKVTKVDADDQTPLAGAEFKILAADGSEIKTGLTTNDQGILEVNDLKPGHYQLVETQAPTGYVLDATPIPFEIVKNQQTVLELSVENTLKPGGVKVTKVDADDQTPLAGAEFKILAADGSEIKTGLTTNDQGILEVNDLKPGHYQLVETQAPTGYVLDATPIPFEIVKNQQTVLELSVENTLKPGGVKVTKVDADDQTPLAGAEFKILAADGSEIKTGLTTNDQGILEVNDLKPGHYQLVETQAPTGYVLDATPIPFEIVKNQQTVLELSVENTLKPGGVKVTKVDADDQTPLAGAEFKILAADGSEIKTGLTTNDQGILEVNDLKPGHYQLVETQAPTGYVLDATPIPFEIVKNQQTVLELSVENTLKPGGVKVTKVDADDQTPLAGAEFKILAADGSEIKTGLTTNDQGILEVNDLKPGHYQLVETQAPTGYVLDATPIPFEIVKNQQTVLELSVENTLKPGGVKVTKVDADDQTPLAGAEFKILAADGSEIKTGLTTNDQGILEVNDLKPGHYQLVETQAPTGYVLDATPIPFEIVKNQQTVLELSVENTLKPGGVKVTKVDADDQTPLAGAEFKILAADGSEIKTGLTTNDQGILEVNDLKPGHYQLVETQAPTGYVLDATPIPFEIVKNQQTVLELSVENTLKPGGVKVTKVDADDQTPLAGAEFKILAADGSEIKTGLTTNDQGILEVNDLKPGHYQLVETQAPTGYVLDATPIPFEIVKNQQTVLELSVENTRELVPDKPEIDKPRTDRPITGISQNYISILGLLLIIIGIFSYKKSLNAN